MGTCPARCRRCLCGCCPCCKQRSDKPLVFRGLDKTDSAPLDVPKDTAPLDVPKDKTDKHYQFYEPLKKKKEADVTSADFAKILLKLATKEVEKRTVPKVEIIKNFGQNVAWDKKEECGKLNARIGMMIAGNSGLPGGGVGKIEKPNEPIRAALNPDLVNPRYTTQEEDVVSSWLIAEGGNDPAAQCEVFRKIQGRFGLRDINDPDCIDTIQGTDYINVGRMDTASGQRVGSMAHFGDAWVVRDAAVIAKTQRGYDPQKKTPVDLIFVAGPCAQDKNEPKWDEDQKKYVPLNSTVGRSNSMGRTTNLTALKNYDAFKEGASAALKAAFDSMIAEGIEVALVAGISYQLYAGPHKRRYQPEFEQMVNTILNEVILDGEINPSYKGEPLRRGQFFKRVYWPRP